MTDNPEIDFAQYQPSSPEDGAEWLAQNLSADQRQMLLDFDDDIWPVSWGEEPPKEYRLNLSSQIHFGFMMAVRNAWLHGKKDVPPIVDYSVVHYGLQHADDISGLIQYALFSKLRGKPYDLDRKAKKTRNFYKMRGMDALTWSTEPSPEPRKPSFWRRLFSRLTPPSQNWTLLKSDDA